MSFTVASTTGLPGIHDPVIVVLDNPTDDNHKLLLIHIKAQREEFVVAHYNVRDKARYQGSYYPVAHHFNAATAFVKAMHEFERVAELYGCIQKVKGGDGD